MARTFVISRFADLKLKTFGDSYEKPFEANRGGAKVKAANVVVEVKEGVVTLSGSVASAALKSKAEELARGAGAKDVKNQLRVSAGR
jgi:hypothetical protein